MKTNSNQKAKNSQTLTATFWKNFAKYHWEKKDLLVKNLNSPLIKITHDEIFNLLVLFADHCRKINDPSGFKFYIDGYQCGPDDVLQLLPESSDLNLIGYHKRMESEFSDYCLVCDELLQVNHDKQHLLTEFTNDLYKYVGFPNRFSEMGLYLGNYKQTPFGVHVDSCGVFSFPVIGTKNFRLWPEGFGSKHPELDRAFEYNKLKKYSTVLTAKPGDMTYWPSSAWHIAESDGSFNATWSLGVWIDKTNADLALNSLKDLLAIRNSKEGKQTTTNIKSLHSPEGEVTSLPKDQMQLIEWFTKLTQIELEEVFTNSWMKHISSQGFKNLPIEAAQINKNSELCLSNKTALVLWSDSNIDESKRNYSFGGMIRTIKKDANFHELIKALNSGKTCRPKDYLKGEGKSALAVLNELASRNAFKVIE